jgi:hypothetical protein
MSPITVPLVPKINTGVAGMAIRFAIPATDRFIRDVHYLFTDLHPIIKPVIFIS